MGGEYNAKTSFLKTLAQRLAWAAVPLDDLDSRVRDLVRAAVLARPGALDEDLLEALASADGDWLARRARIVVRHRKNGVEDLMSALRGAKREEPLIVAGVAISKIGAKKRRELNAWVQATPDGDRAYKAVLKRALSR